jgi:preprotein translocase subunit SecE
MDAVEAKRAGGGISRWVSGAVDFFSAVRGEMAKVTWPTRPQLFEATRNIIILAILLGIMIGLMDWLFNVILVDGVARLTR